MERSLIFFDVDGTLLDEAFVIPDSAVQAIRMARKNSHLCVFNTGRPFSHIEPGVKALGFDGYICSCGQHILLDGERVFRRSLPAAVCQEVLHLVRECRLDAVFESEDGIWFDLTRPLRTEVRTAYEHFAARGFDVDRTVDRPDLQFDKFCVWVNPGSDPGPMLSYTRDFCTVIDREGDLFEFVIRDCSKETGISMVIDRTGIPLKNCFAMGDGANDIPMLRCVPHSIAMGNAPAEVKAMAEYVTDTLHRDGLQKALRHYGLI